MLDKLSDVVLCVRVLKDVTGSMIALLSRSKLYLCADGGNLWMQNSSIHKSLSGHERREGPVHSTFPSKPAEVSSVKDLFEFICTGPLLYNVGLTPDKVAEYIDKWVLYGSQLCRLFKMNELFLNEAQKVRIFHYYIPVFIWCEEEIARHFATFKDGDDVPPLVVLS